MATNPQTGPWLKYQKKAAPKPMPGYEDVPAFLRQDLDMSKVKQVVTEPQNAQDRQSIAEVNSVNPYKIRVLTPNSYGPNDLNHELTHTFQDTRNPELPQTEVPIKQFSIGNYYYGGIQGLQEAQKQRKTISDFNAEQQADMVRDYKRFHDEYLKKATTGTLTSYDAKQMYDLRQAYHPFIQQLANMPGTKENLAKYPLLELLGLQKPATINTRPQPPGLPAYDTPGLGVLPADQLMGGRSQAIPANLPKAIAIPLLKERPILPLVELKKMAAQLDPRQQAKSTLSAETPRKVGRQ